MKEITRIHIAKVSYEAELEAKRELDSYLKTLEAYSGADILEDVELRMTEILAERGVKSGGVITAKDVKALEEQLGAPRDFMSDGDIAIGPDEEQEGDTSRKLFRDIDHAVLGGVLSGIAAFFKISPVLVRILFIIVALASFGTALLVYIVLWIAVPPIKTAADKLQMNGLPVTLSSIRKLNESEAVNRTSSDGQGRKVLLTLLGIFSVMSALGAAALTLSVLALVLFGRAHQSFPIGDGAGFFIASFVLAVISGLLLTTLFSLAAYMAFAMRATKRVVISMAAIIIVGLISFGTALGLAQYGSLRYGDTIRANTHEEQLSLPGNVSGIDSLVVENPDIHIRYIVSSDTPKAVSRYVSDDKQKTHDVSLSIEGTTLKVGGAKSKTDPCNALWCEESTVTIYGPVLKQLTAEAKTSISYTGENQKSLDIISEEKASVVLSKGMYENVSITAKNASSTDAGAVSISTTDVYSEGSGAATLGTVAALNVHALSSCPADTKAHIQLTGISKSFVFNGQTLPIKSMSDACITISIGGDES